MAFTHTNSKGTTYILHKRETTLKNGRVQSIFFFSKSEKDGVLDAVPSGYQIVEMRNGLPVLKKSA